MVMIDLGIPPGFDLLSEDLQSFQEKHSGDRLGGLEKFSLTRSQAILYFNAFSQRRTVTLKYRLRAKCTIRARAFQSRVYASLGGGSHQDFKPGIFIHVRHDARCRGKTGVQGRSGKGSRLTAIEESALATSHHLEGKLKLILQLERAARNRDQLDVVVSLVQGEITGRPQHAPQ
jgi:hypothetical protein